MLFVINALLLVNSSAAVTGLLFMADLRKMRIVVERQEMDFLGDHRTSHVGISLMNVGF